MGNLHLFSFLALFHLTSTEKIILKYEHVKFLPVCKYIQKQKAEIPEGTKPADFSFRKPYLFQEM